MITKDQQKAMDRYAALMEEVKIRIESIEFAISGLLKFHPVIIREFSYLQLRLVCELIALGCLTAHGDIPGIKSRALAKAWSADDILNKLESLHPDFYPHPVRQVKHPDHYELVPVESGFLTKQELLALNGRSGAILHRGNLKRLWSGPISAQPNHSDVVDWVSKIKTLLNQHRLALIGGSSHFVCVLRNSLDAGRVQVAYAEAVLPESDSS
jgi:hypothetical protein